MLADGRSNALSRAGATNATDAAQVLRQPSLIIAVRSLVACLLHRGLQDPDVEDCTQEVLRRAWEGQQRLELGRPVRAWVLGIARHVALDCRRRSARQADRGGPDPSADARLLDEVPSPELPSDEKLERAERARRLDAALAVLPTAEREALLLFHVEGLAYREIAQRMAVPVGTVGTWINRGRERLASSLPGGGG